LSAAIVEELELIWVCCGWRTLYELQIFVILECDTALEFTKSSEEPTISVPVMFYLVASHHSPKDSKLYFTVTIQRTANTVHNTYHNPIHIPTPTPLTLSITLTTIQSTSPPLLPKHCP
jgi:hypothetical protein